MNIRAFRMQFAIVLSFAIAACGGGGGGGGPQQPPPPQGQTISFAQAGPLTLPIGATVTNLASGGGGTGAITYQSSDTSVLTVNATSGLATGMSVGSATVTATKAADTGFTQA
ncbi:MAG TPA: Ig-like domain-containing protein, partial [Steroidobacteraceae bacterium]|nr:Ig-like domain-containing protein [Steroidobacteraceae bacterium]